MATQKPTPQQKQIAANDLAAKIRLEHQFMPQIKQYFNKISSNFGEAYSNTGQIIEVSQYNDILSGLLDQHYTKVSKHFSNQIRDDLGDPTDNEFVNDRINTQLENYGVPHIDSSTQQITGTTQKHLHDIVGGIIVGAALLGKKLTHPEVAQKAKKSFNQLAAGRVPGIAQDQTQFASETGKFSEIDILSNSGVTINGVDLDKTKKFKTWVAILDGVTRRWHAQADGQTVPTDGVFVVKGEQLKYPRDGSLGASADNLIHCRCAAVYTISM